VLISSDIVLTFSSVLLHCLLDTQLFFSALVLTSQKTCCFSYITRQARCV